MIFKLFDGGGFDGFLSLEEIESGSFVEVWVAVGVPEEAVSFYSKYDFFSSVEYIF